MSVAADTTHSHVIHIVYAHIHLLNAYNKLFVSTARQVIHDSCKYIQNDRYWLPDRIDTRFATNCDLFYLLANVLHTNTPRKILVKL